MRRLYREGDAYIDADTDEVVMTAADAADEAATPREAT